MDASRLRRDMLRYFPLLLIFLLLLSGGCATLPQTELQGARSAVARAYSLGADHLATDPYQFAYKALKEGEEQMRRENFSAARESFARAEYYARRAVRMAQEQQVSLEKELMERERAEREKERLAAASRPPQKPEPSPPQVPAPAQVPPSPPPPPAIEPVNRYDVQTGDTLWTISARPEVYGDPLLWPLLYKANRDQIKDPRRVYLGQTIDVPRDLPEKELAEIREQARQSEIFPVEEMLKKTPHVSEKPF